MKHPKTKTFLGKKLYLVFNTRTHYEWKSSDECITIVHQSNNLWCITISFHQHIMFSVFYANEKSARQAVKLKLSSLKDDIASLLNS